MTERQRIIFHILKNQILLQQTQTKKTQCFIHYIGASIAIENGNLSMKIWLWRQHTPARTPLRTGREGLRRPYKGGEGESKTSSLSSLPKGSQRSFSSKDFEFLDCLPYDKDLGKILLLAWSRF